MSDPLASRKVIAACLAVAAIGLARLAYTTRPLDPRVEVSARPPPYEDALRRLSAAIPLEGKVGYVSSREEPNPFADLRYVMSTYALAPRVVVRGTAGARHVVAFFDDEPGLAAVCARYRLVPVARAPGVALTVPE